MSLIKECTACKKRGIFLKLNNGLCVDCSNELKYLEHQYYYLESILRENSTVAEPNKIVEKANLILNNLEKFQNTYTSIEKDICLEVISLMDQQTETLKETSESEPISMNSIIYTDKNFDSSEIILETLSEDDSLKNDLLEYENITEDNEDVNHETSENISSALKAEANNSLNSDELPQCIVSEENSKVESDLINDPTSTAPQSEIVKNSENSSQHSDCEDKNPLNPNELPPSIISDENLDEEPNLKNEDSSTAAQSEIVGNSEEINSAEVLSSLNNLLEPLESVDSESIDDNKVNEDFNEKNLSTPLKSFI
ncbi:hypothetical protein FHH43_13625 [Clostridium perfringens]|nr:hypothetical protein [Clostridium perfringens]